jgi:hypothetical protein
MKLEPIIISKVLYNVDLFGNYVNTQIINKELHCVQRTINIEQYINQFIDTVKNNVLRHVSDVTTIKWNITVFDETIRLHCFAKNITNQLLSFMRTKLRYNEYVINFNETLVIEIINKKETIFLANLICEHFI